MSENKKKISDQNSKVLTDIEGILPEKYQSPEIESEDLLAFAASCNGTTAGQRKASTVNGCKANRLNS